MFYKSQIKRDLKDLGLRVYKDEMKILTNKEGQKVNEDEKAILDIVNKTFGQGTPTTNNIELFNQFLVETAEVIAEPKVKELLSILADFSSVPSDTVKVYKVPKTTKPKWTYTAKGTGVDLQRISGSETKIVATPVSLTYGGYYEITTFLADPIGAFREAVDNLVDAKLDFYFQKITELMEKALSNNVIPEANQADGSALTIIDFQKVENAMIRIGGSTSARPIMYGDIALINHFANQQLTTSNLVTDKLKDKLREELIPSMISKTIAIPFENGYIDDAHTKTKFSPDTAFIFPAGNHKKPFGITEFGTKRQYSTINPETEQVEIKIVFEADVTLIDGRYIGSIKDDSITV